MFNSSIIQVVIGLIFVFALVSILVTQINSVLTSLLKLRTRNLKAGLQEMLTDSRIQARLLAHPVINLVEVAVHQDVRLSAQSAQSTADIVASDTSRVDYIKPAIFVDALVSIVTAETEETLYRPLQRAINTMPPGVEKSRLREHLRRLQSTYSEQTVRDIYATIDEIPDEPTRTLLLQGLIEVETSINWLRFKSDELAVLMNSVERIQDDRLKGALQTVLSGADSLRQARVQLEEWFNENMNRASKAFQRRMQIISLLVAFTLAVVANIDTLHIGRSLWENPELRQALAQAAIEFDQSIIAQNQNQTATDADDESTIGDIVEEFGLAQDTLQTLLDLQLPIGWQYTRITDDMVASAQALGLPDPRTNPRNLRNLFFGTPTDVATVWFNKLIGILATTIAAAQGAPFWFDLLNRTRQVAGGSR